MSENTQESKEQVRTEADRPQRTSRVPFGVPRTKLDVPMELPGKHLHWINDTPGRIMEAQRGGYEFVNPKEIGIGDKESKVKRLVGRNEDNTPMYAYLMKIDLDWYEEDQKVLHRQADAFDEAIKRGKLDEKPGDNRYDAGISVSTK